MLLASRSVKRVHFLIPNEALLKRDREEFDDYWVFSTYSK
jgi:hypothetical protein